MARFLLQNPIAFSATRFDILQHCPRQFFLRYLLPSTHPVDCEAQTLVTQLKQLNLSLEAERYYLWEIMQASRAYLFGIEERHAEQWYFLTLEKIKRMHLIPIKDLEKYFDHLTQAQWFEHLKQSRQNREKMIQLKAVENFNLDGFCVYFGTALMRLEGKTLRLWRLSGKEANKQMQSNLLNLLYVQTQILPQADTFVVHQLSLNSQEATWIHQRFETKELEIEKIELLKTMRTHFSFEVGSELNSNSFTCSPTPWTCRFCRYKNQLC